MPAHRAPALVRFTRMAQAAVIASVCGAAAVPTAHQRPTAVASRSDVEIELTHGGRRRSYVLHVPARRGGSALPVLIAFHGGGGNAPGFRDYAGLNAVADREGFIVVYPSGTGVLRSVLLTFNAGNNCCGPAQRQGVDDVGFAMAVVDDVARREKIDRSRVYATGHSNGAIMAYRLAAERADAIAAIAPVAGAMSLDRFAPSRPVAVLHIHSVDDPRALYEGGTGPPFPGTDNRVQHAPVQVALDSWIRQNGCQAKPAAAEVRRGREGSAEATHTATRLVYTPCSTGAEVVHWKLTVAGHGWPGGNSPAREQLSGPRTSVINAAEEIWAFVSRFTTSPR
jgi:polyhydroxybutyrate depolymerase